MTKNFASDDAYTRSGKQCWRAWFLQREETAIKSGVSTKRKKDFSAFYLFVVSFHFFSSFFTTLVNFISSYVPKITHYTNDA